jgi:flagellar biosynthesis protein FlhB
MSSVDRRVPPGRARVAEAARAGLFARSSVLVAGLAMLSAAAAMAFLGKGLGPAFSGLVRTGLLNAADNQTDPGAVLLRSLSEAWGITLPFFVAILAAALIGAVAPAAIAKRGRGRTSVPLPPAPRARFAAAVLRVFGVLVFLLLAAYILRSHTSAVARLMTGELSASTDLIKAIYELLAVGGVVMILVGLAELADLRSEIWKALHLDSLEARREQRGAGGDPAMKREGARRARRQT